MPSYMPRHHACSRVHTHIPMHPKPLSSKSFLLRNRPPANLLSPCQAEVKRRAESDKQLQSHFEGEVRALQERTATQHADMQVSLKQAIESLSNRMQDLHSIIRCAWSV